MLFGDVGHSNWHTPHPMQPDSLTTIWFAAAFNSIANVPSGHFSTHNAHARSADEVSVARVRRHVSECHTAVPMSMSARIVGTSAPVGQTCMQCNPSHTTHGISLASIYGAPLPRTPAGSILMHCAGHTRTHSPQRLQVSRKDWFSSAPGGRSGRFSGIDRGEFRFDCAADPPEAPRTSICSSWRAASCSGSIALASGLSSSRRPSRKNRRRFTGLSLSNIVDHWNGRAVLVHTHVCALTRSLRFHRLPLRCVLRIIRTNSKRMLARICQSLLICLALICVAVQSGCQPNQSENRDSRGSQLPDSPPQHTPPPRQPSN